MKNLKKSLFFLVLPMVINAHAPMPGCDAPAQEELKELVKAYWYTRKLETLFSSEKPTDTSDAELYAIVHQGFELESNFWGKKVLVKDAKSIAENCDKIDPFLLKLLLTAAAKNVKHTNHIADQGEAFALLAKKNDCESCAAYKEFLEITSTPHVTTYAFIFGLFEHVFYKRIDNNHKSS